MRILRGVTKSLTLKNLGNLLCVLLGGSFNLIDSGLATKAKKKTTTHNRHQNVIQILLNLDWCMEIRDIMFFQFLPLQTSEKSLESIWRNLTNTVLIVTSFSVHARQHCWFLIISESVRAVDRTLALYCVRLCFFYYHMRASMADAKCLCQALRGAWLWQLQRTVMSHAHHLNQECLPSYTWNAGYEFRPSIEWMRKLCSPLRFYWTFNCLTELELSTVHVAVSKTYHMWESTYDQLRYKSIAYRDTPWEK